MARGALEGSRSDRLLRLFDYLLDKTLAGEAPSERQIGLEAFNDGGACEGGQDANVRVYVHRLRKVIDTAFADSAGPKLNIPVGEYCIRLIDDDGADGDGDDESGPDADRPFASWRRYWRVVALVSVLFAVAVTGWLWLSSAPPPLSQTLTWRSFTESHRPLILVVGDYYLYAKLDASTADAGAAPELVWDKTVPTREDLTILQMLDPARAPTLVDYNQQFVSSGTIEALSTLRAGFAQLPSLLRRGPKLVAASQLTPEMLKSSDIIYIGQFSGMPVLLRDPLEQGSGFRIDPGFDGLTAKAGSKRYQSDGMVLTDERIARRDFAYLAGVPGPAGNQLLVVAGVGDAGVKEAANLAVNLAQMKHLGLDSAKLKNGFEALYRVRTIENVNVGSTQILDRPLHSGGIWDSSGNVPVYRPLDAKAEATDGP
ncbi:MAG: hypothetical protein P8Y48_06460 [Novosphingobium sp.]